MEKKTPEALRGRLEGRVPGLMDARGKFAVLVPLVETERGLCLLYEVRSHTLRRQPGEICFPGGELEGDESVVACALRETQEELGIPPEAVTVLGELDFIALRNGATMHPLAGIVDPAAIDAMLVSKPLLKTTLISAFQRAMGETESARPQEIEFDFTGRRLLVAEDNQINAEIAKTLLESKNFEVEIAENGLRALELYTQHPAHYYDAILMMALSVPATARLM